MGIPKASRKGKKAWRKNIDAAKIEEFLQKESHDQRREPAVQALKDEDLFVVDKKANDRAVPAAVRKRNREPKPLRSQLILNGLTDGITPASQPAKKKPKGPARLLTGSTAAAAAAASAATKAGSTAAAPQDGMTAPRKNKRKQRGPVKDIWEEDPSMSGRNLDWTISASGEDLKRLSTPKQQHHQSQQIAAGAATAVAAKDSAAASGKQQHTKRPRVVPAVEVDMPGCSYNPEYEAHQDALAVAVAKVYKKQLKEELAPKAPSPYAPEGYKPANELDELLVDAEADDPQENELMQVQQQQHQLLSAATDENALHFDDDDAADAASGGAAAADGGVSNINSSNRLTAGSGYALDRKTRKDRNREARRKQAEAEAAAKQNLKQQRRELEQLPVLQQQLEAAEQDKQAMRLRRQIVREEKAAIQPPRLGKEKFDESAPAVLTTDEVTGSLRQLQPCFALTTDRFKALQKRGLIEPRKPAGRARGKKVEYVAGEKREKAEARQQEITEMAKARKQAAKGGGAVAVGATRGNKKGSRIDPSFVLPLAVEGC